VRIVFNAAVITPSIVSDEDTKKIADIPADKRINRIKHLHAIYGKRVQIQSEGKPAIIKLHTPLVSFVIVPFPPSASQSPFIVTDLASGAFTLNVTIFPSPTCGETKLPGLKPVFCCALAPKQMIEVIKIGSTCLLINFLKTRKHFLR